MLEAFCHHEKAFIGLSYSELHLPVLDPYFGRSPSSLKPKHLQDWLKRMRRGMEPLRLRFFAVGEYGDRSWRPHFHVVLFGYPTCVRGRTLREFGSDRPIAYKCCPNCRMVQAAWPWGDVDLGTVTHHSASYCASYTVKKMTSPDDTRLHGRHPEFARMSLRPGIGVDAMWDVASTMMQYGLDESMADVPSAMRYGNRELPLGRYLRGKLRGMVGRDEKAPPSTVQAISEELQPLRDAAFENSRSFKKEVIAAGDGRYLQIMAKSLIFKQRRGL